ncbi:unnamed protein product, partial [Ectocarpus sp. 6 AP-2014]
KKEKPSVTTSPPLPKTKDEQLSIDTHSEMSRRMNELMVAFGLAVIQQAISSPAAGSTSGAVSAEELAGSAERFARSCLLARSSDESEALLSWPAVFAGAAKAACLGTCAAGDVFDEGTFFLLELGWKTLINLIILRSLRFLAPRF